MQRYCKFTMFSDCPKTPYSVPEMSKQLSLAMTAFNTLTWCCDDRRSLPLHPRDESIDQLELKEIRLLYCRKIRGRRRNCRASCTGLDGVFTNSQEAHTLDAARNTK
jgi:hypothetical protein